jgi:hypothetical protein
MTFGLASFISTFFPAFVGLFFLNKTEPVFKYFSFFIFLILILECIGNYLFYHQSSNLFVYTICLMLEIIVIPFLITESIESTLIKKLTKLIVILYVISFCYFLFKQHMFKELESEYRIIASVILIFLAGITFIQQSKNMEVHILNNPMFILSFAILLYYGSTLFVNGALHIILAKSFSLVAKQIWNAHSIINIITNILFAYAIWLSYRQKKLSL